MRTIVQLAIAAVLASQAITSAARVTQNTVLCVEAAGGWLSPANEERLRAFAVKIEATSSYYGAPEVMITSVIAPRPAAKANGAELARSAVHWLRTLGVSLGVHEQITASSDAQPKDFGCAKEQTAIEIEAVFPHPVLK